MPGTSAGVTGNSQRTKSAQVTTAPTAGATTSPAPATTPTVDGVVPDDDGVLGGLLGDIF